MPGKRFTKGQLSRAIGSARAVPKVKLGAIVAILDLVHGASHWYSWEISNVSKLIASMFNAQVEKHSHEDTRVWYTIEVRDFPVITIEEDSDATWHVKLGEREP
jgi:hypothetical protein